MLWSSSLLEFAQVLFWAIYFIGSENRIFFSALKKLLTVNLSLFMFLFFGVSLLSLFCTRFSCFPVFAQLVCASSQNLLAAQFQSQFLMLHSRVMLQ